MAGKGFREATKGMTLGEKLEYVWEYYRWVLLVAVFVVIVAAMVTTSIVNTSKQVVYGGATVNVALSEEGKGYLTHELGERIGLQKRQDVALFETSFQDLQNTPDQVVSSAAAMQVVLMITAEDYDYVMMDPAALDFYKNHPIFVSLDSVISQEALRQWEDRIVYHESEDSGVYPLALDITDTAFARQYVTREGAVYIAFPGNTGRTAVSAEEFLAYLDEA